MNRQEIIGIYNKFPKEKQDISKVEFIRQVEALTDPVRAQQDAMQIIHGRQKQRYIEAAIRENNG